MDESRGTYCILISGINPINFSIIQLILSIFAIFLGKDIIKNGYKNLIHKTPNMDTLVGIGVITSFLYSIYNMYLVLAGDHSQVMNLYFESASIVIYFIKLGRYIDGMSKDKTKEAIQKLVEITPQTATIKIKGEEKQVTLDEIHKGDIVISRAGEKIAVDGEIITGKAHLDESFITGESKPVSKETGSKVIAGSLNYDGYIEYKAEKIGKDSTVSEIVRLVVEASNTKAPIAKIADKVAGYFVPAVIIIAILSFLGYIVIGKDIPTAITTFVTILVVACPCSLGLATPLAIVVSEGKCASNGILIKKSEILENAQKVDTIVFDKTGTLTYGKLKISKIYNFSVEYENEQLLQLAGSIESKSTHPIAKAFTDYLDENKIKSLEVEEFQNIAGLGISGKINQKKILLGNAKIIEKYNIQNKFQDYEKKLADKGNSIIYIVENDKILGIVGVNDIDLAEVHDCFSINGLLAVEDLGFAEKGKGGIAIEEGQTEIDGDHPINTSGGLKARGHPLGATGIAQAAEVVWQLRGEAGKRQVDGAEIGMTHNIGGTGGTAAVHIFSVNRN